MKTCEACGQQVFTLQRPSSRSLMCAECWGSYDRVKEQLFQSPRMSSEPPSLAQPLRPDGGRY